MIKCKIKADWIYSTDDENDEYRIIDTYDINPDTQCVEFKTKDGKYHQIPLYNVRDISNWKESDRVGKQ